MAVTDGLRRRLRDVSPATSDRLDESGFLVTGAAAGLFGWGGTQLLAWLDPPHSAVAATALWAVLMLAFSAVTVLHAPEAVRFSDAMFVWGTVNGTAMALTVAALAGLVPERLGFWGAWAAASALGYVGTGVLFVRAGATARGRGYLAVGIVAVAVLALGAVAFGRVAPVVFLVLAAVHAVPLVLDAETSLSPAARGGTLALVVAGLVGAGVVV